MMKHVQIDTRVSAELVGRMILEKEFIQSTQLNIIQRELKNPTFDYGAPESLWELYQYTTYAMKEVHPTLWMDNHIDAHSFFVEYSGIQLSKSKDMPFSKLSEASNNPLTIACLMLEPLGKYPFCFKS
jgi:hypothetical protein